MKSKGKEDVTYQFNQFKHKLFSKEASLPTRQMYAPSKIQMQKNKIKKLSHMDIIYFKYNVATLLKRLKITPIILCYKRVVFIMNF